MLNPSVMKIYASTTDKIGGKLLSEFIVGKARNFGIAGATVWRGMIGYGEKHKIESSHFWEITEKLPIIIEMIDETEKLTQFYTEIEDILVTMPKGCLVTLEPVKVLLSKKKVSFSR